MTTTSAPSITVTLPATELEGMTPVQRAALDDAVTGDILAWVAARPGHPLAVEGLRVHVAAGRVENGTSA